MTDLVGLLRHEELAEGSGHGIEGLRKLADAVRKALTPELLHYVRCCVVPVARQWTAEHTWKM